MKTEKKMFKETAKRLTEMERGKVEVNTAQMGEVLKCFCKLANTWEDAQIIDFVKRYGK